MQNAGEPASEVTAIRTLLHENVYDKNSLILGKVQMLKNSQHPKMNNLIKMMTNLIIKELETWINSKREDSIYD